jgi:hypothetical protein
VIQGDDGRGVEVIRRNVGDDRDSEYGDPS